MRLEVTRGLLLLGALGVATLAAAAWHEPSPSIISSRAELDACPIPPNMRVKQVVRPDQDLLLFMFGLSQGAVAQSR